MTSSESLYQTYVDRYRKAMAREQWQEALTAIDAAIEHCQTPEALPTLAAWRKDAQSRIPKPWLPRWWWLRDWGFPRDPRTRRAEYEVGGPIEE